MSALNVLKLSALKYFICVRVIIANLFMMKSSLGFSLTSYSLELVV